MARTKPAASPATPKAGTKQKIYDPTTELNFGAQKKNVKEELYPKYGIRAVVLKGFISSHTKMAGYANMKTGGQLTSLCAEDKANEGPISLAVLHLEAGFGVVGGENAKWDFESFLEYLYRFREPGALETREDIEEEITTLSLPLDEETYKNMCEISPSPRMRQYDDAPSDYSGK
jgi:hypothetical protein